MEEANPFMLHWGHRWTWWTLPSPRHLPKSVTIKRPSNQTASLLRTTPDQRPPGRPALLLIPVKKCKPGSRMEKSLPSLCTAFSAEFIVSENYPLAFPHGEQMHFLLCSLLVVTSPRLASLIKPHPIHTKVIHKFHPISKNLVYDSFPTCFRVGEWPEPSFNTL